MTGIKALTGNDVKDLTTREQEFIFHYVQLSYPLRTKYIYLAWVVLFSVLFCANFFFFGPLLEGDREYVTALDFVSPLANYIYPGVIFISIAAGKLWEIPDYLKAKRKYEEHFLSIGFDITTIKASEVFEAIIAVSEKLKSGD